MIKIRDNPGDINLLMIIENVDLGLVNADILLIKEIEYRRPTDMNRQIDTQSQTDFRLLKDINHQIDTHHLPIVEGNNQATLHVKEEVVDMDKKR